MIMLKAGNGRLRFLRFCRGYVSTFAGAGRSSRQQQKRHFLTLHWIVHHSDAAPALGLAAEASSASPAPDAATHAKAAKKTSRAFIVFVGVAAATVVGSLAYPSLVTVPPPEKRDPHAVPPPTVVPLPSKETVEVLPAPIANVIPVRLSPREELTQRVDALQSELEELRKLKRDKLVDVKKRGIKDEIKMIVDGLKKMDKAR